MKFVFGGKANQGGVYKILNMTNGRVYIGSTYRFKTRAYGHKNSLDKQRHTNRFLQHDYDKCGPDSFLFEILETVEGNEQSRLTREQAFIDKHYDSQMQCYNLEKKAGYTRKNKGNKNPYDPTTDGRSKPKTASWRKAISEKNKAWWNRPENRKFASNRAKKRWSNYSANVQVTNADTGETVLIEGSIRQFCIDRELSYKAFHLMVKGHTKSSRGWRL